MPKTKKLDIFNLFYSGAAVVILIGVIAKLLEWPAQDLLITGGLAIEALVFGASAIRFVEVKKDSQAATEETLSKVADRLGNVATGAAPIETIFENETQLVDYTERTWKELEQMDLLSLSKDMFYHPNWVNLESDEYAQLTQVFKKLFDKKLPVKEALQFLLKFPTAFPISDLKVLQLEGAHSITLDEIEVLRKALKLSDVAYFLEDWVFEQTSSEIIIRPKIASETQIFGGESLSLISHVKNYHENSFIISPNLDFLQDSIILKGDKLVECLIENTDVTAEQEVFSMSSILIEKSDDLKIMFWNKFDKVTYDSNNDSGFLFLKALVQSTAHFKNASYGSNLLLEKVEIITGSFAKISRIDVINYPHELVHFGADNEYNVKLQELFSNGELDNRKYFEDVIDRLIEEEILAKEDLYRLFELNIEDSLQDLLRSLNYHLAKTNIPATGSQLYFLLLCKVFINS
jgi:hypothetical protein